MNVITITLNPAFDIHCECGEFKAFSENLAHVTSKDAGGKGINISRSLTKNGIDNRAYVVLGDENSEEFLGKLKKDIPDVEKFLIGGRIRENITIHSENTPETRISFSGFSLDDSIIDKIRTRLKMEDLSSSTLIFAGRIPDGVTKEYVKDFLKDLRNEGAKIIVDSKSFDHNDILDIKPWLIKPNEEEVAIYCDLEVSDLESGKIAAMELKEKGIENVLISLGGKGAVYAGNEGVFALTPPKIRVVSTIGAGDSMISGFIYGMKKELPIEETLKFSVAFGSAACLTDGTNPPEWDEIMKIYESVEINN